MTLAAIYDRIDSLEYALSVDVFDDSEQRAEHMNSYFLECRDAYAVPYEAQVVTAEMRAQADADAAAMEAELAELNETLHALYMEAV